MINKAISELYNDKLFISICRKYAPDNFEDLRSLTVEMILELPELKVTHIVENGYLLPYAMRTARNQVVFKYSRFNKLYSQIDSISSEAVESMPIVIDEYENTELQYLRADKIINQINIDSLDQNNRYFFHAHVVLKLKDKERFKNAKQLSIATGIPYRTIRKSITEYYKELKKNND